MARTFGFDTITCKLVEFSFICAISFFVSIKIIANSTLLVKSRDTELQDLDYERK